MMSTAEAARVGKGSDYETDIERDFWGVPILYSKHGGYPNVHMC